MKVQLTKLLPGYGEDSGWVLSVPVFGRMLRIRRRMNIKPKLLVTFRKPGQYWKSEEFVQDTTEHPQRPLPSGWVRN